MTTSSNVTSPTVHSFAGVKWTFRSPFVVTLMVAVVGVGAMLLVDHGPWNKPHLQTAQVNYGTTRAAARAVGATVTPTDPKPAIEPEVPGPKPAQPINPGG